MSSTDEPRVYFGNIGSTEPESYPLHPIVIFGPEWQKTIAKRYASSPEPAHTGHFSQLGGTWWCDTCDSPYCELA